MFQAYAGPKAKHKTPSSGTTQRQGKVLDYVSCAPSTLYRAGGFYDGADLLARLSDPSQTPAGECRFMGEIYRPFSSKRQNPVLLSTSDPAFRGRLDEQMDALNRGLSIGPASAVVCLDSGFLHGNVLYTRSAEGVRTVYETYRANDRPYVPHVDPITTPFHHEPMSDRNVLDLFIGSAGTGNYGHWLVDDLPRAAAVERLRLEAGDREIHIWLTDATPALNAVRSASIARVCEGLGPVAVRFARLDRVYDFKRLHYATPISYHPVLKSPEAMKWLRLKVSEPSAGRRLFVTRKAERGRGLLNQDQVWAKLGALGFEPVEAEGMSFEEQARLFSQASVVVGLMGAAMTNTLFAAPGSAVLYLAPQGWAEPFYWDLAAVCDHRYGCVYGPPISSEQPPHLSSFTIDVADLDHAIAAMSLGAILPTPGDGTSTRLRSSAGTAILDASSGH